MNQLCPRNWYKNPPNFLWTDLLKSLTTPYRNLKRKMSGYLPDLRWEMSLSAIVKNKKSEPHLLEPHHQPRKLIPGRLDEVAEKRTLGTTRPVQFFQIILAGFLLLLIILKPVSQIDAKGAIVEILVPIKSTSGIFGIEIHLHPSKNISCF